MHYKNMINWEYLVQNSKDCGIEKPIYQCLSIAKEYFGAFIPEKVLNNLEPIKPISVSFEEIYKKSMKDKQENKYQSDGILYLLNLKIIDGSWNKARIIFGDIFPSKEFMMYRYNIKNEKQVYLYYLIRLGSVAQWGLAILWQLPRYIFKSPFSK